MDSLLTHSGHITGGKWLLFACNLCLSETCAVQRNDVLATGREWWSENMQKQHEFLQLIAFDDVPSGPATFQAVSMEISDVQHIFSGVEKAISGVSYRIFWSAVGCY